MNIDESLWDAARNGNANTVKALLADGADVKAKDDYGRTALMVAACFAHTDIARLLLAAVRADKELTMDDIRAWAVNENVKKTILGLRVEEDRKEPRREYVNVQDIYGRTALMYAAWNGHSDVVNVLIDTGADVNVRDNREQTALMHAAEKGNSDAVNMLLNAGADVNTQDKCGKTALMLASEKGHADAVKVLLDAGADVNAKDDNGETALSLATRGGHTAVADMLRSAGAK